MRIKQFSEFLKDGIWDRRDDDYKTRRHRWLDRQLKVVLFTFTSSRNHQVVIRSAALTFYSLMSVVPIAALVFAIAKGFSLDERLQTFLYTQFTDHRDVIDQVTGFINGVLQRTRGGWVATVGLVVLLWAVLRVFSNVEAAFNNIWEVKKARGVARKFSDYLALIFIVPILWITSTSATLYLKEFVRQFMDSFGISQATDVIFTCVPFLVMWVMFSFVYYVMPSANVKISSAIKGGIIAGTTLQAYQMIYFGAQSGMSSYNAIYGSFAAIPMFLVWVQGSWQIVLMGAELSFAFQNIEKYQYEREASKMSYEYRKKILLVVMHHIVMNLLKQRGAISSDEIAQNENLPVRVVREAIFELERANMVLPVKKEDQKSRYYVPACDVHTLRIYDVIHAVEKSGLATLGLDESSDIREIDNIMHDFSQRLSAAPENLLVMDIKEGLC